MTTEHFGRYEIKSEIGRGGMATVFHAYDPRFERDVAIKVLPNEFLHDPQFRVRFEREAKTIALLEHPAIVPVYDFGEEQDQPYIVMRYMSGGSLSDRIHQGPMPLEEVIQIYSRLAPALDAAHARGIIHRDVKPGNILFDQYGNSFLSDFGIARLASSASVATITGGNILGTPAYMSPEQVQGDRELDGRSDIYAMGVILFQLLTGNAPYQAQTPARVMMMHILEPVPRILEAKSSLPPETQVVINQAMAKEPDERYATMGAMTADLTAILNKETKTASFPPQVQADATMIAPPKTQAKAAQQVVPSTVIAPREIPQKKGIPLWTILGGGLAVVVLLAAVIGGGLWLSKNQGGSGVKTTESSQLVVYNPTPAVTEEPTSQSSTTEVIAILPTDTQAPTEEPTQPPAADTETPSPPSTPTEAPQNLPVILGGADKVAFLNANDIWVANLDGSDLQQITKDGSAKTDLQWLPDGQTLLYITGKCVKSVQFDTLKSDVIVCFDTAAVLEAFEVSPDGKQAAISIDHEQLYVVPFEIEKLKQVRYRRDLVPLGTCEYFSPYDKIFVKMVHWSKDGKLIGMVFGAPVGGMRKDVIKVLDFSRCVQIPPRAGVEFPAAWFTLSGYEKDPTIQNFGWDGVTLFTLNGNVRNGGFGDLYIWNSDLNRAEEKVNPVDRTCCYRDAHFSPDGRYLVFAYQKYSQSNKIELYLVPVGTIGTNEKYTPIPLPDGFFADRSAKPMPVLRPAQVVP